MLWVKSFHIVFVVSWFAGLLYLPRLYVYHADTRDEQGHARFLIMERKLFAIMTIAAILAVALGTWLIVLVPAYMKMGWMHAKLSLVVLLIFYHLWCWKIHQDFVAQRNTRTHGWFRWFNEVPALVLIATVILVVVRPF